MAGHFTVVAVVVGGAILAWLKKERAIAFCILSGLVALLPVIGIVPIGVVFAVRFLLIPGLFFVLALGIILYKLERFGFTTGGARITAPMIVMFLAVVSYSALSSVQAARWKSDETLMRWSLSRSPNASLAHFLLGNALAGQGKADEALKHFKRAIEERPKYPQAHYNLGLMYQQKGELQKALDEYSKSLEQDPAFRPARVALARLLSQTGRQKKARRLLRTAPDQGR